MSLKKKSKKKTDATAPSTPAWHPNFRNYERLPDIKAVRTTFFINGFAVLLAIAILLFTCYQEFNLHAKRSEIASWEEQIAANQAASSAAIAQFRAFQAAEKKIKEVDTFLTTDLRLSDFLLRLGAILPDHIKISTVDWRDDLLILRGTVSGSPDQASGYASSLVALLTEDEVFSAVFESINLTGLARNPVTGMLAIEVHLRFNPAEEGN